MLIHYPHYYFVIVLIPYDFHTNAQKSHGVVVYSFSTDDYLVRFTYKVRKFKAVLCQS